ncbi:MAG: elongation factor EF-2, partial [Candidatus Diapherotrites archaeon]|nr:elongation factor EF-2 [Candidatus Diapherotrites archaeon]
FVANGLVVSNTTTTDNLIAASGMMSQELAGKQLMMDFEDQEQERGITINAANISVTHQYKDQEYLINIIDTPGHVDFGGDVIRAMRAVDGVILVVDAVEGVMPQTETVVREALREYVKPTLFINKVDRMINELQVTKEEMQQRFVKTIASVNELIRKNVPEAFTDTWKVSVENGSVVFGSAYNNWAISVPQSIRTGVKVSDLYDYCKEGRQKELAQKTPLYTALLEMVINHLPSPVKSQPYRIPVIWGQKTDETAVLYDSLVGCKKDGKFAMMITDVSVDKHAGDIATGRVYSGTIKHGMNVKLIEAKKEVFIQKVGLFMGPEFVEVDNVPAGNIAALVGLREVYAGETVAEEKTKAFESFMTEVEPVITISIEPKNTKDLPKLIEVIKKITKEDPNVHASLNQETGEHLLAGMGELHLEVTQYRIEKHNGVAINVSPPIVVYHEAITKESPVIEAKSPNKHNKFKMKVEPLSPEIQQALKDMHIDGKMKPKDKESVERLKKAGFDTEDAKRIWAVHNQCVIMDWTRGIEALHEIRELVIQGFNDAMDGGPLAKEKCFGVALIIDDANLHEDAIHRGPAQVLPAITRGVYACMLSANPVLLEPKQRLTITVAESFMGAVSKELSSRRTQIQEMRTEGDSAIIIGKAPVKELIGFSQAIRSATQGRALWTAEYYGYEVLPRELQMEVVKSVRTRKGMDPEPKPASFFMD